MQKFTKIFRPKLTDVLKNYSRKTFINDLMSGVIVGIVALPLAIAFGIASGVPPEVGMITAIIGGFVVSILGGSSVQIGGPTGAFIIIVYGVVHQYGLDGLIIATLMAGILLVVMGVLNLGSLIKYIPYPIVVGFTAGIAITIFSTQINDLFGLGIENVPGNFVEKWVVYFKEMREINWTETAFGLSSILIIILTPKISKKIPGSLISIIVLTVVAYFMIHYEIGSVDTIGQRFNISNHIPTPVLPKLNLEVISSLFPTAFTIALLCAIESLLSASVADGVIGKKHNSNTELIAQGAANIIVPFFGGIPVTGAIARTMTNINNGGRTPIAGIIHAIVLLLILLFLGPLMKYIPMSCLAGVLVVVAYNMSGWRSVRSISKGDKEGTLILFVTFFLTIFFDLTVAIEVGLLIAMVSFMKRTMESTDLIISKHNISLSDGNDVETSGDNDLLELPEGVEVYEINGPFFFGIANKFEDLMDTFHARRKTSVRILRMRKVPFMDSTAVFNMKSLVKTSQKDGIQLILSGVNDDVHYRLRQSGLAKSIGEDNICSYIGLAVERAEKIIEEFGSDPRERRRERRERMKSKTKKCS